MRPTVLASLLTTFVLGAFSQPLRTAPTGGPSLTEFAVVGAPYSCEVITETVRLGPNGLRLRSRSPAVHEYRDSRGRLRFERTNVRTAGTIVTIYDLVEGIRYLIDQQREVTERARILVPETRQPEELYRSRVSLAPAGRGGPEFATVREALGVRVIEGTRAEGWRFSTVFAAGAAGNDQPFTVVEERWIAPELALAVLVTRTDPRTGETTVRRTGILRSEPDPALFHVQVPDDAPDNTGAFKDLLFGPEKKR